MLLRVPRSGGRVRAALLPRVDSIVWRSGEAAPVLDRVLAFDVESGMLAAVDSAGRPTRIDLRLGTVRTASRTPLTALVAAEGGTFFGLAEDGSVTRLTPSGDAWKLPLRVPAQELYPQRDGSVLAAGVRGGTGYVWRLRPPTTRIADSASVPGGGRAVRTGTTDRVYFANGTELQGIRSRDLAAVPPVSLAGPVRAIVATPSGDRLYVAIEGSADLTVVDRFRDAVAGTIRLPGEVRDLRIDPLGRYLLARPARGDSAWVLAVGTDRVLGSITGAWRADLPLVLPDGAIAAATGADVTLIEGTTLQPRDTVTEGAADFWHVVQWNGFRPRAAGLDQPVTFGGGRSGDPDSTATDSGAPLPDSAAPLPDSTQPPAPLPPDTMPRPIRPTVPSPGEVALPPGEGYTVQFAAADSEREARAVVRRASTRDRALRVVPASRGGRTFYRVVSGPFASRADAERAARTTGLQFWVYEGVP
ncbi:MAG: SPOR domain-containing protein [Gemmatirosa sp.]